jgi:hypothetical protein
MKAKGSTLRKTAKMNDFINPKIFIAGTSRSGTTLMSNILNKHSDVWITGETHYFDDLRVKIAGGEQQPLSPEEAKRCQDYFLALTHKLYGRGGDPEQGWMSRLELKKLAERVGTDSDSYFEAFCRLQTQRYNKTQLGEKTPRHVFKIPEILARYPEAKVVCMVRHPGGVIASYRNFWNSQWRNKDNRDGFETKEQLRIRNSYHPIIMSLMWKAAFNAALEAREQFGESRVYIQRFEDMVVYPESTLKALTAWLSLNYQPSMLEVPLINSSYSNDKVDLGVGFSNQSAHRWQDKLSDGEIATFQSCCGTLLGKAGYERESVHAPLALTWSWITLPFAMLRALLANRSRISNIPNYVGQRLRLAMVPQSDNL